MKKRESGESAHDKLWTKAGARIGVVSGILGLGLNLINISSGIKGLRKPPDAANTASLPPQIAAEAPSIDASYITLSQELYQRLKGQREKANNAHTDFLASPVIQDGIVDDSFEAVNTHWGPALEDEYPTGKWFTRITCLVLTNRGKRDARSLSADLDKLSVDGPVKISESVGRSGQYETDIRAQSRSTEQQHLSIPTTLEPGGGVIIPLFAGRYTSGQGAERRWVMISKNPLIPKTLKFTDALTNKEAVLPIRKMQDPVIMENGVEGRG